jgi:hypothetical protein
MKNLWMMTTLTTGHISIKLQNFFMNFYEQDKKINLFLFSILQTQEIMNYFLLSDFFNNSILLISFVGKLFAISLINEDYRK